MTMGTAYEQVVKELGIKEPADLRRYADDERTGSTLRDRCLLRWLADKWEDFEGRLDDAAYEMRTRKESE